MTFSDTSTKYIHANTVSFSSHRFPWPMSGYLLTQIGQRSTRWFGVSLGTGTDMNDTKKAHNNFSTFLGVGVGCGGVVEQAFG